MTNSCKKKPCQIIGLAECQLATEELLRGSDHEKWGKDPAVAGKQQASSFSERDTHEYLSIRGNEHSSVLLGVRSAVADSIELLLWSRWFEGNYRSTTGNRKKNECVHKINDWKDHIEESSWLHGKRVGGHVCALAFPSSKQKQRIQKKTTMTFGLGSPIR